MAEKKQHFLYLIAEIGSCENGPIKVGITEKISKRLSNLQCGNPRKLVLLGEFRFDSKHEAQEIEFFVLRHFRNDLVSGEWISQSAKNIYSYIVTLLDHLGTETTGSLVHIAGELK